MKGLMNCFMVIGCLIMLNACSKEKKVEKWLQKGVGEWEVKSENLKIYESDTLQEEYDLGGHAKLIFDENGSFLKISYEDADQTMVGAEVISGKWSNTADEILIEGISGYTLTLKILEIEKKKMKLESTEIFGSLKFVRNYSLEKDK